MKNGATSKIPFKATIKEVISTRYGQSTDRPDSWDERKTGADLVRDTEGRMLKLISDGQQSPPHAGWVLMITDGNSEDGYRWTLYGMPK